jgi:hypothetical protein
MRAMLVIAAVGLAVAVVAPAVAAQGPTRNSVMGSGTSAFCGGPFTINAQSGPSGVDAVGQVACGTLFSGPVTCLVVEGNVARLLAFTTQFGSVALRITDNGPQGDIVEARPVLAGCPRPLVIGYLDLGFSGDIVISETPSLPTSNDQCKNGGWRVYGIFKNQGDCVSFVATGGKNPPANGP